MTPRRIHGEVLVKGLTLLGLSLADFEHPRQAPDFETGRARLDSFKKTVKTKFRELALELHPDRTGGDLEKTEQFKTLSEVSDFVDSLELQKPAPRPMPMPNPFVQGFRVVHMGFSPFGGFGGFSAASNSATTSTTTGFGGFGGGWVSIKVG